MRSMLLVIGGSLALVVGGCQTSDKHRAEFDRVMELTGERLHQRVMWNTGTADDKQAAAAVSELLASELSADAATQVALLNNQSLQAEFEELGIAQADLVQAGLLTNPVFGGSVRFPDGGGGGTNVELSITASFIELLSIPMRKRIATAGLAAAQSRAANAVLELASDVRKAYYELQAALQRVELQQSIVAATAASYEAAKRIHAAGNMSDLALANEQSLAATSELGLADANAAVTEHREHLNVLLGLWGQDTTWTVSPRLPDIIANDVDAQMVEATAVADRLDLLAAKQDVEIASRTLGLTRPLGLFHDAEVGVSAEREVEGDWVTGPELSIPIPLFDQGQGAVARASATLRQAQRRYNAMAVQVRSDVRAAIARMKTAQVRVQQYRQTILPLRQKITEQTQLEYNGMFVGVFELLQAKAAEIEAGQEYVTSLRDYWVARTDLERAIGGRLPAATTLPAATQPVAPSHEHQH